MYGVMMALPQAILIPRQEPRPAVVVTSLPLTRLEEAEIICLLAYAPMHQAFRRCAEALIVSTNANLDSAAYSTRAAAYANLAMQHLTLARLAMRVPCGRVTAIYKN